MRGIELKNIWLTVISVLILIGLVLFMLVEVTNLQGDARVVNYAGIVRGATQRLIKNELYGVADDAEIERLDKILGELECGDGEFGLVRLNDPTYIERLSALSIQWIELKQLIYDYREDPSLAQLLYRHSESYFELADKTVSAAEAYSDGIAARLRLPQILIIADILVILVLFVIEITGAARLNKRLKSIAYVDANTGLPNKRSCEEWLAAPAVIPRNEVVCALMFDLNNLKTINDTMGHETGDMLISGFATVLRRTAPPDMFIGRYGGDEFIGIMYATSRPEIEHFVKSLSDNILALNTADNQNGIRISYACGFALSNENIGCTLKVLMDLADRNMYENKARIKKRDARG